MQSRSLETRQNILQAALRCFTEQGYVASGVAEICTAAGVSKGAFYHHFPTKQTVFLALMNDWLAMIDRSIAQIQMQSASSAEALFQMSNLIGGILHSAQGFLPMFLEFWLQAVREPEIWQAVIEPYRRYQAFFANLVEQGIEQGALRLVDPKAAGLAIVSLAVGLLLQSALETDGPDWSQTANTSIQYLFAGLFKEEK